MHNLVRIESSKYLNPKITEYEFNISKLFLDYFEIDVESDYSLSYNYKQLYFKGKPMAYAERYIDIPYIPKTMSIFRPLKNELHSNLIIELFEESECNRTYPYMEIKEFIKDGHKKFSGFLKVKNDIIRRSIVKSAPSIPILKTSIIANTIFNYDDLSEYRYNIKEYINSFKKK